MASSWLVNWVIFAALQTRDVEAGFGGNDLTQRRFGLRIDVAVDDITRLGRAFDRTR